MVSELSSSEKPLQGFGIQTLNPEAKDFGAWVGGHGFKLQVPGKLGFLAAEIPNRDPSRASYEASCKDSYRGFCEACFKGSQRGLRLHYLPCQAFKPTVDNTNPAWPQGVRLKGSFKGSIGF